MRKVNRVHNNLATEDPTTCTTNTDATCYGYDAFGRLASMSNDFNNTDHDITWTFTGYNAAGQLTGSSASIATFDYKDTSSASDDLISFDGLNRDAGQVAPTGACTSANYPLHRPTIHRVATTPVATWCAIAECSGPTSLTSRTG